MFADFHNFQGFIKSKKKSYAFTSKILIFLSFGGTRKVPKIFLKLTNYDILKGNYMVSSQFDFKHLIRYYL